MNETLIITPKTKVLQLIEAFPELEDILIAHVPAFNKLKNPILRKTVARIATLQQAASVGNVAVEDLINLLRKEVGQELVSGTGQDVYNTSKPSWFSESLVVKELDAKPMLAEGEHPVNQVMADLNELKNGSIYKLAAPFLPASLIDKASSLRLEHWVVKKNNESYWIYFFKQ